MNSIKIYTSDVTSIKIGSSDVAAVYIGSDKVYPSQVPIVGCDYKLCGICTDGTEITVSSGTTTLTRGEIYNALGEKYLLECEIGSGTTTLGEYAFDDNYHTNYHSILYVSSITISDSVTTLQHECLMDCYNLTTLTIPSSVTQIDFWAFTRLSGLTEVIFEGTTPPTFTNYMNGVFHDYCPPVIYVPDSAVSEYRAINGYVWTNQDWSRDIIQPISNRP